MSLSASRHRSREVQPKTQSRYTMSHNHVTKCHTVLSVLWWRHLRVMSWNQIRQLSRPPHQIAACAVPVSGRVLEAITGCSTRHVSRLSYVTCSANVSHVTRPMLSMWATWHVYVISAVLSIWDHVRQWWCVCESSMRHPCVEVWRWHVQTTVRLASPHHSPAASPSVVPRIRWFHATLTPSKL